MRASAVEYRSLHLRAHQLLHDVPLYDVSSVDLPGGGIGRTIADIRTLESATPQSHIATFLYGLRYLLGRVFGWDQPTRRGRLLLAGPARFRSGSRLLVRCCPEPGFSR